MESGDRTDLALEAIAKAQSRSELWATILDFYRRHGIEMVTYQAVFADDTRIRIVADGFPTDFQQSYIDNGLASVDPIHRLSLSSGKPFRWKDIRKLADLTEENDHFLRYATEAGLTDGLAFGVFGPNLRNAFVGLGFGPDTPEPRESLILAFQLAAQAGHLKYCEFDSLRRSEPQLSRRELETLQWIARGKSNSVIAEIMEISPHTVDTLLRRIYGKLEVGDRTTAAIRALGSGVIQYPEIVP